MASAPFGAILSPLRVSIPYSSPRGFHLLPMDAQWMLKGCSMVASATMNTLSMIHLYIVTLYFTLSLAPLSAPNSLHALRSRINVRKPACPISSLSAMSRHTSPAISLSAPCHEVSPYSLQYSSQNSCMSDERLSFSSFSYSTPASDIPPLPIRFPVYAAHNACYQHALLHLLANLST